MKIGPPRGKKGRFKIFIFKASISWTGGGTDSKFQLEVSVIGFYQSVYSESFKEGKIFNFRDFLVIIPAAIITVSFPGYSWCPTKSSDTVLPSLRRPKTTSSPECGKRFDCPNCRCPISSPNFWSVFAARRLSATKFRVKINILRSFPPINERKKNFRILGGKKL